MLQQTPLPFPNTSQVHLCLALVRLVSWAALEEISDDLALDSKNPGHKGGLLSLYPSFAPLPTTPPFSPTSCFQVQGKVKALRMHSPDFTTRQAGGAVLCSDFPSIYSFTLLCSLIFISLARAFTAINTVSKLSSSNMAFY